MNVTRGNRRLEPGQSSLVPGKRCRDAGGVSSCVLAPCAKLLPG
ncbi:Hypothetical protein CAP_6573 [Chondromyces apiculatus DSM 436]|uniref:Uncharacterized protein n=1 Tax=Chondromyces apiculatus DSM 436 TaxID=1192034 RepID=A0A017T0E2_9BACT|nr:Hypothetical protein CAP_6573 [Chondromyces apiculatus DSM 436]